MATDERESSLCRLRERAMQSDDSECADLVGEVCVFGGADFAFSTQLAPNFET